MQFRRKTTFSLNLNFFFSGLTVANTILISIIASFLLGVSISLYNVSDNPYWLCFVMFAFIFCLNYLRAKIPNLNTPMLISLLLVIGVLTGPPNPPWFSIVDGIMATLTGIAIVFVCNALFWPVSAMMALKQEMTLTLSHMDSLFELTVKIFLHEATLAEQERAHQLLESCRSNFSNLSNLLEKSKSEVAYDKLNFNEKQKVKKETLSSSKKWHLH